MIESEIYERSNACIPTSLLHCIFITMPWFLVTTIHHVPFSSTAYDISRRSRYGFDYDDGYNDDHSVNYDDPHYSVDDYHSPIYHTAFSNGHSTRRSRRSPRPRRTARRPRHLDERGEDYEYARRVFADWVARSPRPAPEHTAADDNNNESNSDRVNRRRERAHRIEQAPSRPGPTTSQQESRRERHSDAESSRAQATSQQQFQADSSEQPLSRLPNGRSQPSHDAYSSRTTNRRRQERSPSDSESGRSLGTTTLNAYYTSDHHGGRDTGDRERSNRGGYDDGRGRERPARESQRRETDHRGRRAAVLGWLSGR